MFHTNSIDIPSICLTYPIYVYIYIYMYIYTYLCYICICFPQILQIYSINIPCILYRYFIDMSHIPYKYFIHVPYVLHRDSIHIPCTCHRYCTHVPHIFNTDSTHVFHIFLHSNTDCITRWAAGPGAGAQMAAGRAWAWPSSHLGAWSTRNVRGKYAEGGYPANSAQDSPHANPTYIFHTFTSYIQISHTCSMHIPYIFNI